MMKTIVILTMLMAAAQASFGQNTFPSSGSAGVGTTSPGETLEVTSAGSTSIQNVVGIFNPLPGVSATNSGAALIMGLDNDAYYSKIATIFEDQNPDFLQPGLAFYTMHNTYLAG